MATMQELIERIVAGPAGQQARAEIADEQLQRRRAAMAEIERLAAEHEQSRPPLLKAVERAQAEVDKARAALATAEGALGQARGAVHGASHRHDRARDQQERILRELAPECIAEFGRELEAMWEAERRAPIEHEPEPRYGGDRAGWLRRIERADAERRARFERMGAARQKVRDLALTGLDEAELHERFEAIKAWIATGEGRV
jgi:hypothetical protein